MTAAPQNASRACAVAGEMIDRLITIDFPERGVIDLLYPAARAHLGAPLTSTAAQQLSDNVRPGQVVIITTGWLDRPHISRQIAETDGPPGAAVLARALHLGLGAVPVLLVEAEIVQAVSAAVQAAGLRCTTVAEAIAATTSTSRLHAAAVLAFPTDSELAAAAAREMLAAYDIGAFVAIEKGGRNSRGEIHTSRGDETTAVLAKTDVFVDLCRELGIPTIGVGDGGNEIGMGTIAEALHNKLRFADECRCGCGGGVVPDQRTDVLIAATVSNWGGYGIAAALAVLLGRPELLHTPEMEEDILRACARAGLIDGVSGLVGPTADGLSLAVHRSIVTLLHGVVGTGVNSAAWN